MINNFQAKYEMINSKLSISGRSNEPLRERINELECNNLNNGQYNKRDTLEISQVLSDIVDDAL